jgi:SAM-dependent methyltransferase
MPMPCGLDGGVTSFLLPVALFGPPSARVRSRQRSDRIQLAEPLSSRGTIGLMSELEKALRRLRWTGDEAVLDVGGDAALAAAARAPDGRLESVAADAARELTFDDESFDVVASSRALHAIPHAAGRELAVRQIVRVLRPGGRVVIVDVAHTGEYVRTLQRTGMAGARRSRLRWSSFPPSRVVEATKPRWPEGAGDRAAVIPPPRDDEAEAAA